MHSSTDIFICVQAIVWISVIDCVCDEPGLKSVASATAQPASIILRAGA